MNNKTFNELFGTEVKCVEFLFDRIKNRKCSNCSSRNHKLILSKKSSKCLTCGTQRTLKSQTFMINSNFPFTKWFEMIYLVIEHKENYSNAKIQRIMNMPRYASIFHCLHKIRHVMRFYNSSRTFDFNRVFDSKNNLERSNKHQSLPNKTLFKIKDSDRNFNLQIEYFRKDIVKRSSSYRFKKITNLPSESNFPTHTGSNHKIPRLVNILEDIRFLLKRVHKWVSDFFIQLYLEEYCFKINATESLWDSFFESSYKFRYT